MCTKLAIFFYSNKKHLWLDFILHLNLIVSIKYGLDLAIYGEWFLCTYKQV